MDILSNDRPSNAATDARKRRVLLASPLFLVGLGYILARASISLWEAWSWIPVILYYWAALATLIAWGGGRAAFRRWLVATRRSRWIWVWRVLALAVPALFFATGFLPSLASMNGPWVPLAWFGLGALNAWIEEGYWRGLLLDAASGWPGWLGGSYSALLFGASRALIFGFQEEPLKGLAGFVGATFAGLIWGFVYQKTRSLRLPVLGHFLQQMLAPPYHVFQQLVALLG